SLCVFCGAQAEVSSQHLAVAAELGSALAKRGITLVFGGGATGMMGVLADAALAGGGKVIGVAPRGISALEKLHQGITEMVTVDSMHARKQVMFERSDAVAVLPGGIGTLDEFFEILTWKSLSLHDKPIFLLNNDGYWNGLLATLEGMAKQGFTKPETLR